MTEMTVRGQAAAPGAAVGRVWRHGALESPEAAGTPEQEQEAVDRGLRSAAEELERLAARLRSDGHIADADIVEANLMMATDPSLVDAARAKAAAGRTAGAAIQEAAEPHIAALATLDDPVLAARAADLRAVARRAAELSRGLDSEPPAGAIVVAQDLGPGEVAAWASRVSAIVLISGSTAAHAAIVARSLGVPLVTGAGSGAAEIPDGEEVAIDADRGIVVRAPRAETLTRMARRIERRAEEERRALLERDEPSVTLDGRPVRLLANAGTAVEVDAALEAGAEGIGLLRTELGFLEAAAWPTEEQQRRVLQPMIAPLANRIATVRTFDFGGDKTPPFLRGSGVESMLGPRGIRLTLSDRDRIVPQLRALLRVAGDAVLRILLPMVTEPAEVEAVRDLVLLARADVAPEAPEPLVGAMIEVPAAALNAHAIARVCDFLSIGTNDLVQYTLAADRENAGVAERAVAYHPAVLRLVARSVTAAHSVGIPCDVCGEAAGDRQTLPLFVGLGVDELSVSPARLAPTRRMIRELSFQRARAAAATALAAATPAEAAAAAADALSGPAEPLGERFDQRRDRVERR
jgi:phosphoenolpyruvate-protein phosphotransferase